MARKARRLALAHTKIGVDGWERGQKQRDKNVKRMEDVKIGQLKKMLRGRVGGQRALYGILAKKKGGEENVEKGRNVGNMGYGNVWLNGKIVHENG